MKTKVFISWSGKMSQELAKALRRWLPNVIQAVEPWLSAEDIGKGTRWSLDLAGQLEQTRVGIICLTPENLDSLWIHFEAGALSKTLENTYVCPFLFKLEQKHLSGPLEQFQATKAENKEDVKKLVHTINKATGDEALSEVQLDETFEVWWPRLEQQYREILYASTVAEPNHSDRSEAVLNVPAMLDNLRQLLNELRDSQERLQQVEQVDISKASQVMSEWWFSPQSLNLDIELIEELYSLLRDYYKLPRSPGCAPALQQYVISHQLTEKLSTAIEQVETEISRFESIFNGA